LIVRVVFSYLSDLDLLISSYKSLIAVTNMMKLRGMNISGYPSDLDIYGIIDNNPNIRK